MNGDDDPPLSIATFEQIVDEIAKRSMGCVVGCVLRMNEDEEHVYADWRGKTLALGLISRIQHNILHEPNTQIPEDSG